MAYKKRKSKWGWMKPNHIEICKDPHESIKYCSKEGKVIEFGNRPTWNEKGQKLRNMEIINGDLMSGMAEFQ